MARQRALVDTGPLVALLSKSDHRHQDAKQAFSSLDQPIFTCWPVLVEVAWLLKGDLPAVVDLIASCQGDFCSLLPLTSKDTHGVAEVVRKYADQSINLADAALVHLANRDDIDTVVTFDRRDFSIYRRHGNLAFSLLP